MNQNIQIVATALQDTNDGLQKYMFASIQDLKTLKHYYPNSTVRYSDITPRVRQNCDATVRVISKNTINDLGKHNS